MSQLVTCPPEIGPPHVRLTRPARPGGESNEEDQAHARADHPKLREAEKQLATGKDAEEVCRSLEISVQTYHRWKAQYQAIRPEEVARPKALENQNKRLKKIVADQALDIDMLKEVARGSF